MRKHSIIFLKQRSFMRRFNHQKTLSRQQFMVIRSHNCLINLKFVLIISQNIRKNKSLLTSFSKNTLRKLKSTIKSKIKLDKKTKKKIFKHSWVSLFLKSSNIRYLSELRTNWLSFKHCLMKPLLMKSKKSTLK